MKASLSNRSNNLKSSSTLAFDSRVKIMQRQGIGVINLGLGEPDFDTPDNIKKAGIKAIEENFTHYTATEGILELRKAITDKLQRENNIEYLPEEIVVGTGSKQILYEIFQVLCEEGDEVLIPIPTWDSYIGQVKLADATPVLIPLQPPFKLTLHYLENKLTTKTKAIMFNSPGNPAGAMIEDKELRKIGEFAVKHNIWILADEMYEKIVFGKKHVSIASLSKKIQEHTITINGFSKTYAMTGWRIGYAAGPEKIIKAVKDLQSQITANTSSISQKAAIEAYTGEQTDVKRMVQEYTRRRDFLLGEFAKIANTQVIPPDGSFFLFINVSKLLNERYPTATHWCEGLLEQKQVALIGSEAFDYPGYVRLSFSASMEKLKEAVKRIREFIE